MRSERGGALLAVVLVFLTAALLLAAAVGVIVLGHARVVETAAQGEENLARAQSAVEWATARLALDPAWRPTGTQTVAWQGGSATLDLTVETPPALVAATGRSGDVRLELRLLIDAPTLLAVHAETEVRLETGVEITGATVGDPVWPHPAADPPPRPELVVAPADAPALRPLPVTAMAVAATRPHSDAVTDSATFKDEIVVLVRSDADDTRPFVFEGVVLENSSVLVQGDLVIQDGFDGKPRPGYPLIVATGRITIAPSTAQREAEGVIAAAGDVGIYGRLDLRGHVQGATVVVAGAEDAPVEIAADPAAEAIGFEPHIIRRGWSSR